MKWCYETVEEASGWVERGGLGVAFRRTPTGRDAAGRPGAYFVHALVWRSGTLPLGILPRLWDAGIWRQEPPRDDPPARLQALRYVEELGLSLPQHVDRDLLLEALAGHLANVAAGMGSSLELPPREAFACAAAIAQALPPRFELPAFSTFEAARNAARYDMVAGAAATSGFRRITPSSSSDRLWRAAADLLLEAADGEPTAASVVESLTSRANTMRAFATALRRWVILEGADASASAPDLREVAAAAANAHLIGRLVRGPRARDVARAVLGGHMARDILRAAETTGRRDALVEALEAELSAMPERDAVGVLVRLARLLEETAYELARRLGLGWLSEDRLGRLRTPEAIDLLRLLMTSDLPDVVGVLLTSPVHARRIVADRSLPPNWRGYAAAVHPHGTSPMMLVEDIAANPWFAEGFRRSLSGGALDALREGFTKVRAKRALEALQAVTPGLSAEAAAELAFPVLVRLDPRTRLEALEKYTPRDGRDAWTDLLLDTFVALVLDARHMSAELPTLHDLEAARQNSARARAWGEITHELGGTQLPAERVRAAAVAAGPLRGSPDADAAFELILDFAADHWTSDCEAWFSAMQVVRERSGESPERFTVRLARTAVRPGATERRSFARWTIVWTSRALAARELTPAEVDRPPFIRLFKQLRSLDIEPLTFEARNAPRGPARRWLEAVVRALSEHYDRA